MSAFTTTSLLAALTTPPASGANTGAARSAVARSEASFSRQLEQLRDNQAREKPRTPQPEPRPTPAAPRQASNTAESNTRAEAARAARARADRKPEAPPRNQAEPDADAPKAEAAAKADGPEQKDTTQAALAPTQTPPSPTDADAARPALTRTLTPAELPPPKVNVPVAEEAVSTAAEAGDAKAAQSLVTRVGTGAAASADAAEPKNDTRTAALRLTGADGTSATWQQAQATASLTAQGIGTQRRSTVGEDAAVPDQAFALPGVGVPGTSSTTGARIGEAVRAEVSTPATAPEFRAALGAHVSLLARAGVQQAELRLNPAEMGPVSIQIVLDGQQAQVNFGADSALTRQIIESGMPELASALREAGLTLTGGGVSQHAGGQRRDAESDPQADGMTGSSSDGASKDDAATMNAEAVRRSAARSALGGVDLYA
jgi:flagellar hook-length control protein FliK